MYSPKSGNRTSERSCMTGVSTPISAVEGIPYELLCMVTGGAPSDGKRGSEVSEA